MKREELKTTDTWNLEALFENFDDWNNAFQALAQDQTLFTTLKDFQGTLHLSAQNLKNLLDFYMDIQRKLEKIYVYAHLKHDEDGSLAQYKKAYDQVRFFYMKFLTESSWVQPEILSFSTEVFHNFLEDELLSPYHIFLKKLFKLKPYTLSEKEEKLIALGGKVCQSSKNCFDLFNNIDLKLPPILDEKGNSHNLSHGLYSLYMQSKDRTFRKNAFETMHKGFQNFENTLCELLQGHVQTHVFHAQARGYKSCLEASLHTHEIDPQIYTTLLESATENLDVLHGYIHLKKELLNLDKFYAYDAYVSCATDFNFHFTYEEAKEIVIEAVAPLGKEYQQVLSQGLHKERWVDPFENTSKRSGAYSSGCYDSHPYILMNFHGTLNDLMTLAHEAGHSMHSYYSDKNQPYVYSQYVIFVAEVASTFNEDLVFRYLLNKASSEDEKLFLIHQKLEGIRATFFRQTLFAEFELKIHELAENQEPLNPELLKKIYKDLNKKYYGPSFEVDDLLANEYLRIPHFYSNFYVYQYATGISAALSLVEKVLSQKDASCYLQFLSSGCVEDPVSLLQKAGVDMTTKKPTETLCQRFRSLTCDFKNLLKEKKSEV